MDIKKLETYHKINKGVCTLTIYSGTQDEWKKSSIVTLEGNKITKYDENPKGKAQTHLTNIMVGIAEPEIFDLIPKTKLTYSLQEDVFPELAKDGKLVGYLFSGKWKNIDSIKDIKK